MKGPLDKMPAKEGYKPSDMGEKPASDVDDAASDVLAAVKAGDAKALGLALKRHYLTCQGEE